jgi:hypothetical protein
VSIFICWVLFPLVVTVVALGCGLLVNAATGGGVSGVLLLPVGLALVTVASAVVTYRGATAPLATPLVLVLAAAGYVLSLPRGRLPSVDWWAGGAGLGVLGVFAAPVVLSGHATFLGYTLLGDTSIHFILADWVIKHGQELPTSLPPSSYHAALQGYMSTAYPVGVHAALGSLRPLVGQDVAWVYQPFLAYLSAMTALSVYGLVGRLVPLRPWRAAIAFLAAQPGLVYAYALEGSIKELATIWVIALTVALCAEWVEGGGGLRRLIPLALTVAAGMAVLNVSVLPWLGPAVAAALVAIVWRRRGGGWRPSALEAVGFAALVALLSFPSLAVLHTFVSTINNALTGNGSNAGNLFGPLSRWQVFGIWPMGDFRFRLTNHHTTTFVLIWVEIAAIVVGVAWAVLRRSAWPLVLLGASLIGWAYTTARGGVWADAKSLMIASPAVVTVAMLAPAALWEFGRRWISLAVAAALAFGILWTNALAYHTADLAPRDRFDELSDVGSQIKGQGPTLYTEFEEFSKHFLRAGDPTGSNEYWQDPPRSSLVNGQPPRFGFSSDIDDLANPYVERFRTLVLRRGGGTARPPGNYRLVSRGKYYEVWRRASGTVVAHLPLGISGVQPGAVPACTDVRAVASKSRRLAYVERPLLPVLLPVRALHPRIWVPDGADPQSLRPFGAGTIIGSITVTQPGRYRVWVQGSFGRRVTVRIDRRRVGEVKGELNPRGQSIAAGEISLSPGRHTITLTRPTGSLFPGDGGRNRLIGPVVLDPATDARAVRTLPSSRYRQLCGKRLDWVEAIR